MEFLANMYAILATIPFLSYPLIYYLTFWRSRDKKKSHAWAINLTTVFLASADGAMFRILQWKGFVWWFILLTLVSGLVLGFLQYRLKGNLYLPRLAKGIWRVMFVFLSILYLILFSKGIAVFYANL
ncbi:DUF3397 domain-containing protein [Microaerobacter geothermalis]|uniref:DUF3397 domain-containing protein n=1 Tax=Microaerobacter geothermalis TaxID=674972 RepID=UPI001F397BDE|nr:DUF3397 domain-containing protein [Microaerobacter geothermalis]MCF6093576.1 DUF3397 domain-containing protein [Microaerobacter geothermalis]